MNAIFYMLRGGVAWRLLPRDLPPKSTVLRWFALWRDTGLFETMNHLLVMADRERVGREASPQRRRARQPIGQDDRERRPGGLGCGKEGEGPQAPGHGGHRWVRADPRTAPRRHSGPGRRAV